MSIVYKALIAASILGCQAGLFAGEAPPAQGDSAARAKELVQALGSESYSERSIARRELLQLGRAAIDALEYAAQSDDSETRVAAATLLIAMRGRGFMGIGLQEEQPGGGPEAEDDPVDEKPIPPPVVNVTMVPNGRPKAYPAELAGVMVGDKVLEVNGRRLAGVKDLMREVINVGPARVALVVIDRDGKKLRLPLLLTHNPNDTPPPVDLEKEVMEESSLSHGVKSFKSGGDGLKVAAPKTDPKDSKDLKAAQAFPHNDAEDKSAVKK
jgi:hypothetical protein